MDDHNDIDDLSRSSLENYKMNPSPGSWNALDAKLSARRSEMYKAKMKRYRLLAAGLALLLFLYISFNYLTSSNTTNVGGNMAFVVQQNDKNNAPVTTSANEKADKSLPVNASEAANSSETNNVKKDVGISIAANTSLKKASNNPAMFESKKSKNQDDQHLKSHKEIKSLNLAENNSGENTVSKINPRPVNTSADASGNLMDDSGNPPGKNSELSAIPNNPDVPAVQPGEVPNTVVAGNDKKGSYLKADSLFSDEIPSRWSIAGYYSPDYSKNHLKDNSAGNNDETEFYENENPDFSFTTGISLRYDLTRRWSVSAGIAYSTIAYSITQSELYADYSANNELHYQYPTSCGIIQMPQSDYPVSNLHDSLNMKAGCLQKVRFIKVPVTARFTVKSKRLSYYSDFGFAPSFTIKERAKVTIQNSETTIINNIDGLKKMNFDFLFGMGIQYNFLNGTGIFIEPSFRSAITSLTYNTPVNCYPYSFGLAAGISVHF